MSKPNPGHANLANGAKFRFKPGHETWNKGKKGVNGYSATRFKPGNKPQTWKPIGTERIDKDGNLTVKVSDEGSRHNRWVPVHRLVWIAANGPVPADHFVVFKIGMKTDVRAEITLDRLECVNRSENMKRNSVHTKYPPELQRLAQLRGAITRQINKRQREASNG